MIKPLSVVTEYHPVISDWLNRVRLAGGSVPSFGVMAHNRFINDLISTGTWRIMSKKGAIFTIGTSALNGCEVPLIQPTQLTVTRHNFVNNDYALTTGLNPGSSNSTKAIITGYIPSQWLTSDSGQISCYSRSNNAPSTFDVLIGAEDSTPEVRYQTLYVRVGSPTPGNIAECWSSATMNEIDSSDSRGLFSNIRTAVDRLDLNRNGTNLIGNSLTDTALPPNTPIGLFCLNKDGFRTQFSKRVCTYFYIGDGLTQQHELNHYNAVQRLQSAYRRQV